MSLSNCQNNKDLFLLYEYTTFFEEDREYTKNGQYYPKWNNLKEDNDESISIPECSYLGSTCISLSNVYENCGYDCLFIQELLKLYMEGKIVVKEEK